MSDPVAMIGLSLMLTGMAALLLLSIQATGRPHRVDFPKGEDRLLPDGRHPSIEEEDPIP